MVNDTTRREPESQTPLEKIKNAKVKRQGIFYLAADVPPPNYYQDVKKGIDDIRDLKNNFKDFGVSFSDNFKNTNGAMDTIRKGIENNTDKLKNATTDMGRNVSSKVDNVAQATRNVNTAISSLSSTFSTVAGSMGSISGGVVNSALTLLGMEAILNNQLGRVNGTLGNLYTINKMLIDKFNDANAYLQNIADYTLGTQSGVAVAYNRIAQGNAYLQNIANYTSGIQPSVAVVYNRIADSNSLLRNIVDYTFGTQSGVSVVYNRIADSNTLLRTIIDYTYGIQSGVSVVYNRIADSNTLLRTIIEYTLGTQSGINSIYNRLADMISSIKNINFDNNFNAVIDKLTNFQNAMTQSIGGLVGAQTLALISLFVPSKTTFTSQFDSKIKDLKDVTMARFGFIPTFLGLFSSLFSQQVQFTDFNIKFSIYDKPVTIVMPLHYFNSLSYIRDIVTAGICFNWLRSLYNRFYRRKVD